MHRVNVLSHTIQTASAVQILVAASATPALGATAAPDWRVIVRKGAQIPSVLGTAERRLEVLSLHQGDLEPLPFQVDDVTPDGSYALPYGLRPVVDDRVRILNRRDDIVMMLSDFGQPRRPSRWVAVARTRSHCA